MYFIEYNDETIRIEQTETFEKWLDGLRDKRTVRLIVTRLERLAHGHFGDVKPIGAGLSELRIHYGAGYRIYFQQRGNEIILLLCAGDKSSQQGDIKKAQQIAKQWSENHE